MLISWIGQIDEKAFNYQHVLILLPRPSQGQGNGIMGKKMWGLKQSLCQGGLGLFRRVNVSQWPASIHTERLHTTSDPRQLTT